MLGDGACVGAGAYLLGHEFTRNGKLKRGPVIVGDDCTVGPNAPLTRHVTVKTGVNVPALVCAMPGQTFQAKGDHTPRRIPPGPPPSQPASPPGPPVLQDEADDGVTL